MAKKSAKKRPAPKPAGKPAAKPAKKRPSPRPSKKKQGQNRILILSLIAGAVVLVLIAVIAITVISNRSSNEPVAIVGAQDVTDQLAGIPQEGLALGSPDAPVTLIDYSDLKCPVCMKFSNSVLPQIINDYVRTGKVRIVFHYLTFVGSQKTPGDSERGARFGLAAAQQNKLWNYNELFYHNQQNEDLTFVTDTFLTDLGNNIPGLNVQQAFSQMDSDAVTQQIADQKKAFTDAGFNGVPSFQISKTGTPPQNITTQSLEYSVFKTAIDNLL